MDEFLLSSSSDEAEDTSGERVARRILRDKSNPMSLPNKVIIKRFRLTKDAFEYVLAQLNIPGHLSTAVPKPLQLAATLSVLASGGYQHLVRYDYLFGMAQSTISKVVSNVVTDMENGLCSKFIQFTSMGLEAQSCKKYLIDEHRIPGVIGCIDGTHINFQKPTENEYMFFNRKGKHSINSMIICDHRYRINAINSMYGGAVHDSFIWTHANERDMLESQFTTNQNRNSWLLEDSGYPIEPWCITYTI